MPKIPKVRTMGRKQFDAIMELKTQKVLFRKHIRDYKTLYVFSRGDIRQRDLNKALACKEWESSQIWINKNKIMRGVLNQMINKNMRMPDLTQLCNILKGSVGLLFTNRPPLEVHEWFKKFSVWDYARPGYIVVETVTLGKGPLTQFRPEIEPYLRQLGMPTEVKDGVVMLRNQFQVCKEGTILSKWQANILELLGEKLAICQMYLKASWTKKAGLQILFSNERDEWDSE